jgi:Arc/MetJ-type ribon-helix-helix transcriptional regulator
MDDKHLKSVPAWGTDAGGYSLDEFYIRATNSHDHSRSIRVHLPPEVTGRIAAAVEAVPMYRNAADVVRDAIVHRLHYLDEVGYELAVVRNAQALEQVMARMEAQQELNKLQEQMVQNLKESVEQARSLGQLEYLSQLIAEIEDLLPTLTAHYAKEVRRILLD